MLDFGFEKIIIIGVIGVVVLGPERLPVAARMLGILWARAQKMTLKFRQELNDLQKLAETPQQMLSEAERKMQNFYQDLQKDELNHWQSETKAEHLTNIDQEFDFFLQKQQQIDQGLNNSDHEKYAAAWLKIEEINQKSQFRQSHWRLKSMATPLWFQRKAKQRRRLEGSAARMQRYQIQKPSKMKSSIF